MNASLCSLLALMFALLLGGCGVSSPRFTSKSRAETAITSVDEVELEGIASYYADEFHQRQTANGETYNMNDLTAAHRTLPFNTKVKVRNLKNGKSVVVRINDRGPFKDDRIIDLSYEAAKQLALILDGTGSVALEILEWGVRDTAKSKVE